MAFQTVTNSIKQIGFFVAIIVYPFLSLHLLLTLSRIGHLNLDHVTEHGILTLVVCLVAYLIVSTISHVVRDILPSFNDSIARDASKQALRFILALLIVLPIAVPFNLLTAQVNGVNFAALTCLNTLPFIFRALILHVQHLRRVTVLDWRELFRPTRRAPVMTVMQLPNQLRRSNLTVQFGTASMVTSLFVYVTGSSPGLSAWKVGLLLSMVHLVVESVGDYRTYAIGRPDQWARLNGQDIDSDF